jgi:hypothetical protein
MFELNRTNQNDYQYGLYQEQLQQIKKNSLIYSNNPELVIKYFSINMALSNNIDQVDVLFPQNVPTSGDDDINQQDYTASNTSAIHGTGMFDKFENFTYDIFEFTPVLEMSPFQYSPNSDNNEGTSGNMSLLTIDRPKVGDLFTYYAKRDSYGKNAIDQTEIFQVTSVQMQRSSNDLLPIYQLEFKTANILYENLKKFSINQIYFYDNLQNNFTNSECWDEYQIVSNQNDDFKLINKNFNKDKSYYEFNTLNINNAGSPYIEKKVPLIFNNLIKRIQDSSYNQYRLKIVKNISTNLSIDEFLGLAENNFQELLLKPVILDEQTAPINIDLLTDEQIQNLTQDNKILINLKKIFTLEGNNTFLIKNTLYLYLFYYFLYKDCYDSVLYSKLHNSFNPDDLDLFLNPLTPEDIFTDILNKYQTDEVIAFVDKDLRSNEFIIIDDLNFIMNLPKYIPLVGYQEELIPLNKVQVVIQNNFNIYKLLFNYLNTVRKIAFCDKEYIKFPEDLEKERNIFTNSSKLDNTKYYNIFNCSINPSVVPSTLSESTDTSGNFYWNNTGIIIDYVNEIVLPIGDLGLPIALSFQYGVQYRDIYNPETTDTPWY